MTLAALLVAAAAVAAQDANTTSGKVFIYTPVKVADYVPELLFKGGKVSMQLSHVVAGNQSVETVFNVSWPNGVSPTGVKVTPGSSELNIDRLLLQVDGQKSQLYTSKCFVPYALLGVSGSDPSATFTHLPAAMAKNGTFSNIKFESLRGTKDSVCGSFTVRLLKKSGASALECDVFCPGPRRPTVLLSSGATTYTSIVAEWNEEVSDEDSAWMVTNVGAKRGSSSTWTTLKFANNTNATMVQDGAHYAVVTDASGAPVVTIDKENPEAMWEFPTPPTPAPSPNDDSKDGLKWYVILAIVLGSLVCLVLVAVAVVRHRSSSSSDEHMKLMDNIRDSDVVVNE